MIKEYPDPVALGTKIFIYGVIVIILLTVIFGTLYTIPAGYKGVLLTFNKPSEVAKGEGLHFKIPIVQSVIKMDVRTQKYESKLSAASKDLQNLQTEIAINYRIVPESVVELYRTVGIDYADKVIVPVEAEANKYSSAQFNAEELIQQREKVRELMLSNLREKLQPRGIVVEDISIINFEFSKSFTESIETKVVASQQKLKADMDLQRIRVEAEQKIAQAGAEAESLRLQKQQITPELLQLRQIEVQSKALDVQSKAIDKWNGGLPQVTGNNIPFINVDIKPITSNNGI
jgi:regulator of protease activity HflC (stomatin/prohibitin superfamily)